MSTELENRENFVEDRLTKIYFHNVENEMSCLGESKLVPVFKKKNKSNSEEVDVKLSSFDNVKTFVEKLGERPEDVYMWITSQSTKFQIQEFLRSVFKGKEYVETNIFKKAVRNAFVINKELDDVDSESIESSFAFEMLNNLKSLKILKTIGFTFEGDFSIDPFSNKDNHQPYEISVSVSLESNIVDSDPLEIYYITKGDFDSKYAPYFDRLRYDVKGVSSLVGLHNSLDANDPMIRTCYLSRGFFRFKSRISEKSHIDTINDIFKYSMPNKQFPLIFLNDTCKLNKAEWQTLPKETVIRINAQLHKIFSEPKWDNVLIVFSMVSEYNYMIVRISHKFIDARLITHIVKGAQREIDMDRKAEMSLTNVKNTFAALSENLSIFDQRFLILTSDILTSDIVSTNNLVLNLTMNSKSGKEVKLVELSKRIEKLQSIFTNVRLTENRNRLPGIDLSSFELTFEYKLHDLYEEVIGILDETRLNNIMQNKIVINVKANSSGSLFVTIDNFKDKSDLKNITHAIYYALGEGSIKMIETDTMNKPVNDNAAAPAPPPPTAQTSSDSDAELDESDKSDEVDELDELDELDDSDFIQAGGKWQDNRLQNLHKADEKLFGWKVIIPDKHYDHHYPRKCMPKKYPVVVTNDEIKKIDKTSPNSYFRIVKTGSDVAKCSENYYICPRYWCPKSRVSLNSPSENCPEGEEMVTLYAGEIVSPYLLKPDAHPEKLRQPCCSLPIKEEDNVKGTEVINGCSADKNTRGLPKKMKLLISNDGNTEGCDTATGCFGILNSSIERAFEIILNMEEGTIRGMIKSNLSPQHFIRLKNGYYIKAFFDPTLNLRIENERKKFRKWIQDSKDYMASMSQSSSRFIDKFDNNLSDPELLREYIVFNSYNNYKAYLDSDIPLTYDDLAPMLQFGWFNESKKVVLNFEDLNETLRVNIPFQHSIYGLETSKSVSCIFEDNTTTGLIVRIPGNEAEEEKKAEKKEAKEKKAEKKEAKEKEKAEKKEAKEKEKAEKKEAAEKKKKAKELKGGDLSKMDTNVKLNKKLLKVIEQITDQNTHMKSISKQKIADAKVKKYVIDSNYRCCGAIIENDLFVPFSGYYEIPIDENLMYLDRVNEIKTDLSNTEIEAIYKKYNVSYSINGDHIELKDLGSFTYKKDKGVNKFSLHSLISIYEKSEMVNYFKELFNILKNHSNINEVLSVLRHAMNPMTDKMRIDYLEDAFSMKSRAHAEAIYRLPEHALKNISRNYNEVQKNAVYFGLADFMSDFLLQIYDERLNPFQMFTDVYYDDSTAKTERQVTLGEQSGGQTIHRPPNGKWTLDWFFNKIRKNILKTNNKFLNRENFKNYCKRRIVKGLDSANIREVESMTDELRRNKLYTNEFETVHTVLQKFRKTFGKMGMFELSMLSAFLNVNIIITRKGDEHGIFKANSDKSIHVVVDEDGGVYPMEI